MVDVLIGIALFALFVSAVAFSMLLGQESVIGSSDRVRAIHLTEQAMEVARAVRNANFGGLVNGTHGFAIGSGGTWVLSGSSTVSSDGFVTTMVIGSGDNGRKEVEARTRWSAGGRSGSVALFTEFSDWRAVKSIGNWSAPAVQGSYVDGGTPLFNHIAVSGDYAFVASETSDGGAGLYVFAISDLANPQRVASAFALGAPGYRVIARSGKLYVATGSDGGEVRVYDIANPASLSADNLLATINVPGSSKVRAIALYGNTLFVGALEDATAEEFFAYDVADLGAVTPLDSLQMEGGCTDIALREGFAYLSTTADTWELRVIDVFDPSNFSMAVGSGYNLTDVHDGSAIAAFGTSALLGRVSGAATEELVLFSVEDNPVPSPPPGPWYLEAAGTVSAISVAPGGQFAFVASDFDTKEFRVVNVGALSLGKPPEVGVYNATTGAGRGVLYDMQRDRAFFTTNSAFIILRPAA